MIQEGEFAWTKDPELEIAVSLTNKLGTGKGTISGGRMTSAKAWILGKTACVCAEDTWKKKVIK